MKVLLAPVVLLKPAQNPAKKLLEPMVLLRPAHRPINVLLLPVKLHIPAHEPAKKLLLPAQPPPVIQDTVLLPFTQTVAPAVDTKEPFTYKPTVFTLSLSQVPVAKITELFNPAVPITLPMITLHDPVVTAQPELVPRKILQFPLVTEQPE